MKLGVKLIIIILTLVILIVGAFTIIASQTMKNSLEQKIGENQLELAKQSMDEIDRVLFDAYQDIVMMSGRGEFENAFSGNKDFTGTQKELQKLTFLTGPWDDLQLASINKEIISSDDGSEIGKKIHTTHRLIAFENVIENEEPYFSDLIISSENNKPTVIFAAPVRDDETPGGPVIGVVIGQLSWLV